MARNLKSERIQFRLTAQQNQALVSLAHRSGFPSASEYVKALTLETIMPSRETDGTVEGKMSALQDDMAGLSLRQEISQAFLVELFAFIFRRMPPFGDMGTDKQSALLQESKAYVQRRLANAVEAVYKHATGLDGGTDVFGEDILQGLAEAMDDQYTDKEAVHGDDA